MGLHVESSKYFPFGDLSPFFGKSYSCFTATGETIVLGENVIADTDITSAADDGLTKDPKPKDKSKRKKGKKKKKQEKKEKQEATGPTTAPDKNTLTDSDMKQAVDDGSREVPKEKKKCGIDPDDKVRAVGVCALRGLRRHRPGVDAGRFYKTTRLTEDALELPTKGSSKRKTEQCKCPYSPCLCRRAALRPWKWMPFALRMLWARALCALCQRWLHPATPPPATRFASHLAAADAARNLLMERNAKYNRQSMDPVFCLAAQIPYFDCDRSPTFAYREMMRRLRETRDRQLGRYQEEPITRECKITNGREMCDVGTQVAAQADGSLWRGLGRVMFGRAVHTTLCHAYAGAKLQLAREPPPSDDTLMQACVIKPIKKAVSKTKTQISDAIEKALKDPVINNEDELWHLHVRPIKVRYPIARSRRTYHRPRRGPLATNPTLHGRTMDGDSPVLAPDMTSSSENLQKLEMGDTQPKNNTTSTIDTKKASSISSESGQQLQGMTSYTTDSQPATDGSKSYTPAGSESPKSVSFTNEQKNVVNNEKLKVTAHVSVIMDTCDKINDPKILDNDGIQENKKVAEQTEVVSKNTIIEHEHDVDDTLGDLQIISSSESNLITRALVTKCRDASNTNYLVSLQNNGPESASSCRGNVSRSLTMTDDRERIALDDDPAAADDAAALQVQVQHVSVRATPRPPLCARVARHAMMAPRHTYPTATGGDGGGSCC